MTDHLVEPAEGWPLWNWIMVRGAGFPARRVLELATSAAATAADDLAPLEEEARRCRKRAIEALRPLLDGRSVHERRRVEKALKALRRGELPADWSGLEAEAQLEGQPLRELAEAEAARSLQRERLEEALSDEQGRISQALRDLARDPRFREAVLWQSPRALHTGIDRLLAKPSGRTTSQDRRRQHLAASYLQRYCVKNDTIGFFGPYAWSDLTSADRLRVRPGQNLLAQRDVYFEHWAIDALAEALTADEEMKPYLAPHLRPDVRLSRHGIHYGIDRYAEVPPTFLQILSWCDGQTPAQEIARALLHDEALDLSDEDEAYELLEQLNERNLISWTLELPSGISRPEQELARMLERLSEPRLRDRALAELARLTEARDQVGAAAGDPGRLERALSRLDTTFNELTGQPSERRAGQAYAGRTLIYEDCLRDLSLSLGRPWLDRLAPVLDLVAPSARWFTFEVARRFRSALRRVYDQLRGDSSEPVRYTRFWREISPLFTKDQSLRTGIVEEVADECERHWASLLGANPGRRRVELTSADLVDGVKRAFDAPGPGWPGARHLSPDIMVAADGAEGLASGEFRLVLGEVHLSNTLLWQGALQQCPDIGQQLIEASDTDLPAPRIAPVETKHLATRADTLSWSSKDLHLELGASRSWRPREQVLRVADLVVDEQDGSLVVVDELSGRRFDVIAFLEQYLSFATIGHFRPKPPGPYIPRVTIDGVVLCREQWSVSPQSLAFAWLERGADQFAAARRWKQELGLPRWVFVKVPEEPKPVYVDLESSIYVEMLAKLVRKASRVTLTEMLPTPEETWLPDAEGRTYTSELRFVVVDPLPWRPPGRNL